MSAIRTICGCCGVGCGIVARPIGERRMEVGGDARHPASRGQICPKGVELGESGGAEGRLLHPEIGGRRASWDRAIAHVARRLADTIARHGPGSVAFLLSGGLVTEDYYVANKLMKGFIGAANIDVDSSPRLADAAAAHIRAFGEDVVPATRDDLDQADLFLLVGCDLARTQPVAFRRMLAAREARGAKLAVIDPRPTESGAHADLHLPIRSGSDVALMTGLLALASRADLLDMPFLEGHVATAGVLPGPAGGGTDIWSVARACAVPPADLQRLFDLFAGNPRTVTLFGQELDPAVSGADQASAIINLHLATGRIGKPGAAPFCITGQPNAMGAREVGALPAMLAAHMDFAPAHVARLARFWGAPAVAEGPGLGADGLLDDVGAGGIRALWVMGADPLAAMPDNEAAREALARCPFLIVSDSLVGTVAGQAAHVRLPAAAPAEMNGTMTTADRLIGRRRALFPLAGEARSHWWMATAVARAMGWADSFYYERPADIYREHARLTAYENGGSRLLDLRAQAAMSNPAYDGMTPARWGGSAVFAEGRFRTPDGRARMVPVVRRNGDGPG